MKRFVLAAALVAALGSSAGAQPVPGPITAPPPTAVPVPNPDPVPPFPTYNGPPGPAIPFHKSGGRVVGLHGYYPYDTGLYLLGDGAVSRQAGFFTMVYPEAPPVGAAGNPPASGATCTKHKFFRR